MERERERERERGGGEREKENERLTFWFLKKYNGVGTEIDTIYYRQPAEPGTAGSLLVGELHFYTHIINNS